MMFRGLGAAIDRLVIRTTLAATLICALVVNAQYNLIGVSA